MEIINTCIDCLPASTSLATNACIAMVALGMAIYRSPAILHVVEPELAPEVLLSGGGQVRSKNRPILRLIAYPEVARPERDDTKDIKSLYSLGKFAPAWTP